MQDTTANWRTGAAGAADQTVAGLSALERAAVLYLAFPVAVFLVGWFRWWVAVPAVLLLAAGLKGLVTGWATRPTLRLGAPHALLVMGAAVLWASLGGAGHLIFCEF